MLLTRKAAQQVACFLLITCSPFLSNAEETHEEQQMVSAKGMGSLLVTSDPVGSEVRIGDEKTCSTPCKLVLPPGKYSLVINHRRREEERVNTSVSIGEQTQVHVVLGEKTPWKLIVPTYFVGAIFVAGGISSILVHGKVGLGSSDLPADEHRFHRNIGIASVVIGVPLLTLATYLIFVGKKSDVRTSMAPYDTAFNLLPMTDTSGAIKGMSITLGWR